MVCACVFSSTDQTEANYGPESVLTLLELECVCQIRLHIDELLWFARCSLCANIAFTNLCASLIIAFPTISLALSHNGLADCWSSGLVILDQLRAEQQPHITYRTDSCERRNTFVADTKDTNYGATCQLDRRCSMLMMRRKRWIV